MKKKKSKIIVKPVCLDAESIEFFTTLGEGNLSKGIRDSAKIIKALNAIKLVNNSKTSSK